MSKNLIFLICFVLALGLVSGAGVANASLVGWYQFENNANDSSTAGNHGTPGGGPGYVAGYVGNAMQFDGVDDNVAIPRAIQDDFTIALWVKTTQTGGTGQWWAGVGLVDGELAGSYGDFGAVLSGTRFGFGIGPADTTITSSKSINDGTWHHVVAARVASTGLMEVYVDGVLENSTTGPTGSKTAPTRLTIGSIQTNMYYFNGVMDEVRIYSHKLSLAEIMQVMGMKKAWNPTPTDGNMVDADVAALEWGPGVSAALHDVYFSDNFDDVNTADSSDPMGSDEVYKARQTELRYPPGAWDYMPVTRGTTYHWRIDEVNGVNVWRGDVWSFTVVPNLNWNPNPAHQATYVPVTTDLSWSKGNWAVKGHIIYLSTSFNAVNNVAPGTITPGVPPYLGFTNNPAITNIAIPGDLLYNTTHYWRADPIVSAPPVVAQKGEVWRFTTLSLVPISDPNLAGWWKLDGEAPGLVFDYSGHANHGTPRGNPQVVPGHDANAFHFDGIDDFVEIPHSNILSVNNEVTVAAWINAERLSGPGGAGWQGILAKGNSPRSYSFYTTTAGPLHLSTAGIGSTSTLLVTTNEWTHVAAMVVGGVHRYYINGTFAGEGGTGVILPGTADSAPVRISATQEASRQFLGVIDDVRIYNKALSSKDIKVLAGRLGATDPDPADGATDVQRTLTLTWEPGAYAAAANGHRVYFDPDEAKVIARAGCQVNGTPTTDPCYPLPWTFGLEETFYWAVDEVNGINSWPGNVWSFTTTNNKVVDDMETYTPWDVPDNNIFEVWVDGPGNCKPAGGNNTGALVDIDTATAVHGGLQSMKYMYDNDGTVDNPCEPGVPAIRLTYSKAEAQVAQLPSGIGSDWTVGGVAKSLSLWFYGDTFNSIEPMWVQLTDASNNKAKVFYGTYADEDTSDMNEASWHEWLIDLEDFNVPPTPVNVKNVKSIAIGIGDEGPSPGSSGTLYFDDIRLYAPRCILARREADFALVDYAPEASGGDCVVDYRELAIMSRDWLAENQDETALWTGMWTSADIGDVGAATGSFTDQGGGTFTIVGAGADIWGTVDAFHYAFKQFSGDGQITIRLTSIDHTNDWAKTGPMIRETLDANSKHAMIIGRPNNLGIALQWRPTTGGSSLNSQADAPDLPYCLRLVRVGDTFTGYYYSNGKWIRQSSATIPMTDPVYIGMAVTSHTAGTLCTAQIDRACSDDFIPADVLADDIVDFKDYSELILKWLDEN